MGLFDKKICDLCGKQYGLLGGKKLQDGLICKDCLKEASPWLGSAKQQTIDEMKRHLADRVQNQQKLESFTPSRSLGSDMKLYIDDRQALFTLNRGDYRKNNSDLFRFDQILAVHFKVDEQRTELSAEEKNKKGGNMGAVLGSVVAMQQNRQSPFDYELALNPGKDQQGRIYDESQYRYSYEFEFSIDLRDDWVSQIRFTIGDGFSEGRSSAEFQSAAAAAIEMRNALQQIQQAALGGQSAMTGAVGMGMGAAAASMAASAYPQQVPFGQNMPYGQAPYGQSQPPYSPGVNQGQQAPYSQQGYAPGQAPYPQQGYVPGQAPYPQQGYAPGQAPYPQQGYAPGQAPYPQQGYAAGQVPHPQQGASQIPPQYVPQMPVNQQAAAPPMPYGQSNSQPQADLRRCPYCGSSFSPSQNTVCPACNAPVSSM